ncbi:MAG: glycosyltransferase family 25 protein [Rhodoferax sp.]|nr:glycosyltransferase family 25 protein [Rhodoferax sp.]
MTPALNTFFDQVVVINLASRPDRRREMRAQLQQIGLDFGAPGVQVFEATKPVDPAGFSSAGARGCFLSHLAVLRMARDQAARSVLILEDDVNFSEGFIERFAAMSQFLEHRAWGMVYGSYALDAPLTRSATAPCVQVEPQRSIGTTAYVAVHGKHLGALVSYLEAMLERPAGDPAGGPMHIDGAYCWFRQAHPDVVTWLTTPPLAFQRASKTDVHALKWFDQATWLTCWVAMLRRWRNHLRRISPKAKP